MNYVSNVRQYWGAGCRRVAQFALLGLAAATSSYAADRSWSTGNGTWGTPGNWQPAGVPGVADTARIGNLAGVQDATVSAGGATTIPAAIQITNGMTLDMAGIEFVRNDLVVTVSDGGRMIVRPHPGGNAFDFAGRVNIDPGASFELSNNVPVRFYGNSYSRGDIAGWGEVEVNSTTPFNNSGVIRPGNGGLRVEQVGTGNPPFDLDGTLETGGLWIGTAFTTFELTASGLADPFDGEITMTSGDLITMNLDDGWSLGASGHLYVIGTEVPFAAAQIDGSDFDIAGALTVMGHEGILRVLADTTVEPNANIIVSGLDRLEFDGTTIVNGGDFQIAGSAQLDFDGQTTIHGGSFSTDDVDPANGSLDFNGSTTWAGSNGPIFINGVARQMGNAFVNGPTYLTAHTFDMDGDGDTLWTVWNDLTINAYSTQPGEEDDTFTGTLNIASANGKLTMHLDGPAFYMNGEMNLTGHPSVYNVRYAGESLDLQGELNVSGKVGMNAFLWGRAGALNIANANATLRLDAGAIITDCAISGDGELRIAPGAANSVLLAHANLNGVGVTNEGSMGVPGYADVDRFQQTATGQWHLYLRGYDATDNDQLRVTGGDAILDGALDVNLFQFAPVVGDEFTILTATGNVIGQFDANPSNCEDGRVYYWSVIYDQHTVTLRLDSIGSRRGDMNCDCLVNNFDIDPFVMALSDPAAYAAAYPGCYLNNADANGDGLVNNFDIDAFVECLAFGCP